MHLTEPRTSAKSDHKFSIFLTFRCFIVGAAWLRADEQVTVKACCQLQSVTRERPKLTVV